MKRAAAASALAVAAVVVPGGLVLSGAAAFWILMRKASTGDAELDALRVRGRVVLSAFRAFGPVKMLSAQGAPIVRALMAIVNNEWNRRVPLDAQVGDQGARRGPSVGPMQVYRGTATDLGLYTVVPIEGSAPTDAEDRARYAELASDLSWCFFAGATVFKDKLQYAAGGDIALAIERYNGSGPDAAAYRERAIAFVDETFGGLDAAA